MGRHTLRVKNSETLTEYAWRNKETGEVVPSARITQPVENWESMKRYVRVEYGEWEVVE